MKRIAVLISCMAASAATAIPTQPLPPPPPPGVALATPPLRYANPRRVVSLNLCSDELALALAAPDQLASVSRAGKNPVATTLAAAARNIPANDGTLANVLPLAPDLVIAATGDTADAARALGIAVVEVVPARSLEDVRANIRRVATALGRNAAGSQLIARMNADLAAPPADPASATMITGGGRTVAPESLAAQWLRHAGLRPQPGTGGRVDLAALATSPPRVLVITRYPPGQVQAHQSWLASPLLRQLPASVRRIETDGRPWTCMGPALSGEIVRLREALAR